MCGGRTSAGLGQSDHERSREAGIYWTAGAEASEAHLRKSACKERVTEVAIRSGL